MLPVPERFTLVAGTGEGASILNAFDHALMSAGVADLNLIRVSSILPPGCRRFEAVKLPPGALLPAAYACVTSDVPGEVISAAVAVGRPSRAAGVIMEFSGRTTLANAQAAVVAMVREALCSRYGSETDSEIEVAGVEHTTQRMGCAFAAVALWYDPGDAGAGDAGAGGPGWRGGAAAAGGEKGR
jgi:arginine decarboxylase